MRVVQESQIRIEIETEIEIEIGEIGNVIGIKIMTENEIVEDVHIVMIDIIHQGVLIQVILLAKKFFAPVYMIFLSVCMFAFLET